MNNPTPNPPAQPTPQATSKPLRIARLVISLGLIVGVGAFGVLAINDLSKPITPTATNANTYGASDALPGDNRESRRLPGDLEVKQTDPLLALGQIGHRTPIAHHPGKFKPFINAEAYQYPPFREKVVDSLVIEQCDYRYTNATPQQAFEHYNALAIERGMKLLHKNPSSAARPGGLIAAWTDGPRRFELSAWPTAGADPTPPPLKPKTPLQWVVKYSYPVPPDTK